MKRPPLVLAAIYDTETCNYGKGEETRAYPILFIENDIRDINIYDYEPDRDDKVHFYRTEDEMLDRIDEYILWGELVGEIPIICAYNLMFDLQPLMEELNERYEIRANAQSSTNVYTLDLYSEGIHVLRFWDTYHLEMGGLSAMGKTAGLSKANGDWDYSLIRTPTSTLTDLERFYAKRDVQVIPAYLRYLLHANEWMQQSDLGFRVLTKTSIVRQMARKEIERLPILKKNGKKLEVGWAFMKLCKKELPKSYQIYALRKACFRGGFTFTSARYSMTLQRNVASADVTSMHHTFINGRYIPQDFKLAMPPELNAVFKEVLATSRDYVLKHYAKPFKYAFHARVKITNIRLRKKSCFKEWGIALESSSKFKKAIAPGSEIGFDPANVMQENATRSAGWCDQFEEATFAFGKLYEAKTVILHVNELELWTLSRVYEWDTLEAIFGETTGHFKVPPDFVTLQSNKLFEQKSAAKFVEMHYKKGVPYTYDTKFIPDGIAELLKNGTLEPQFFHHWYTSTVKGEFNGIYGTQAQDIFKPSYKCENGELVVDESTVTTEENYTEHIPKQTKVLYTYGMRIVGGSRMHMVLALELLYEALGKRIRVLGGDTDSMKVACNDNISDEDLERALEPIAIASTNAINLCMERLRKDFPDLASGLNGIGAFEIENRNEHYQMHFEMWNKARLSFDGKEFHITCAGLPRPIDSYTIETFLNGLFDSGIAPERIITECLGFNTKIDYEIAHTLEHHKPKAIDVFDDTVTDYNGVTADVYAHESIALYPSTRWLGETLKIQNRLSVEYLESAYGRDVDTDTKYIRWNKDTKKAELYKDTPFGPQITMSY